MLSLKSLRSAFALLVAGVMVLAPAAAREAEPGCKPDMAQNGLIRKASLQTGQVRISFVGHATFLIESPGGASAATDYNDFVRPAAPPTVATMNKAHSTHYSRNPDPAIRHVLRGWDPAGGRASHDLTVGDMRVRNVPTNLRSWSGATDFDGNSIFIFEVGDLCIVHLGHLHHTLEPGHLRAIGRADVVLVPVDGNYTLDIDGMMEVLKRLQARVMIPMHFFGQATLQRFLFRASADWPIDSRDSPVLVLSRDTLPGQPTIIVLPGR